MAIRIDDFTDQDFDLEQREWTESLDSIYERYGASGVREVLRRLQNHALGKDIVLNEATLNTPYRNTIPVTEQPPYPGNIALEDRIEKIIRWNAAAMVVRAADSGSGVGGHIATYTSAATMMEVGFHHPLNFAKTDFVGSGNFCIPFPNAQACVLVGSW